MAGHVSIATERVRSQREVVLESALDVFSREGFDGAKVRDIAARAGCNHAVIRYHFQSKENLWRESVRFLFERMESELQLQTEEIERLRKGDPRVFRQWIRRYVSYCARHPDHARIMVQASIRDDEQLDWAAREFIAPQHERMVSVIQILIANKALPNVDPVHMLYCLVAACHSIFTLAPEVRRIHGLRITDQMIDQYADTVIAMLQFRCLT